MKIETTEWFDKRYKPRYNGLYQVMLTAWPWPVYLMWDNTTGWENKEFVKWRGIKDGMA